MQTVTVTIGRNVGPDPLPADIWNEFVSRVRREVERVTSELWAVAPFRGQWEGESEDAMVFYGPLKAVQAITRPLPTLRANLANLATYYRQDAIGLSVGESELVESWARQGEGISA